MPQEKDALLVRRMFDKLVFKVGGEWHTGSRKITNSPKRPLPLQERSSLRGGIGQSCEGLNARWFSRRGGNGAGLNIVAN